MPGSAPGVGSIRWLTNWPPDSRGSQPPAALWSVTMLSSLMHLLKIHSTNTDGVSYAPDKGDYSKGLVSF